MKLAQLDGSLDSIAHARIGRRTFLNRAGLVGLGVAASAFTLAGARGALAQQEESESSSEQALEAAQAKDTVTEIFTAALIAEDLATTFYYNGLIGGVIQDPSLAGPGGSANMVSSSGNAGNVNYLQAALTQEISHANLFRSLLGGSAPGKDPVQTFYFPSGAFDTLTAFTGLLNSLENAFIGAYLNAIQEFSVMSTRASLNQATQGSSQTGQYTAEKLDYFAKVAASILGIEAEHRVLGRVISNTNPANNLNYEQTDGLNAVYNGPDSAVAALIPFLSPGTGPGFSLAAALADQGSVSIPSTGNPPAF